MSDETRRPGAPLASAVIVSLLAVLTTCAPSLATVAADLASERSLSRNDLDRRDLDPAEGARTQVWLLLGSDERGGQPLPRDPRHVSITGQRADSISLWMLDQASDRPPLVLSLPRDLRVAVAGHGEQKLGGSYDYGPRATVRAVRELTGLPVHHVIEVDFTGVVEAVDALGGLDLLFEHPARDTSTGLALDAGWHRLSGTQVLALSRSRNYEELLDGTWIATGSGDLARIEQQHRVFAAVVAATQAAGPGKASLGAARALSGHVIVDEVLAAEEIREQAENLRSAGAPRSLTLPVRPEQPPLDAVSPFPPGHVGNVGHLVLQQPEATRLIRDLRTLLDHGRRGT